MPRPCCPKAPSSTSLPGTTTRATIRTILTPTSGSATETAPSTRWPTPGSTSLTSVRRITTTGPRATNPKRNDPLRSPLLLRPRRRRAASLRACPRFRPEPHRRIRRLVPESQRHLHHPDRLLQPQPETGDRYPGRCLEPHRARRPRL